MQLFLHRLLVAAPTEVTGSSETAAGADSEEEDGGGEPLLHSWRDTMAAEVRMVWF